MRIISLLLLTTAAFAQTPSTRTLIDLAQTRAPGLEAALRTTFMEENLQKGTAAAGELGDYVWAVASTKAPSLRINNDPLMAAYKAGGLWVVQSRLRMGTSYKYTWLVDGSVIGGANDLRVFGPDSYAKPGVPVGKLTGPIEVPSKIYPDVKANMWFYVPAQWDGVTALPVQVWGDGQFYTATRPDTYRILETLDNLTAQKRIPLMVNVFIQPGTGAARNQRSIEYDTVSDTYARRVLDEVLPVVGKSVKLRADGYSRAIVGESSGGIAAFNAAFFKPEEFSRVLSWIGSFAALQVSAEHPAGGGEYPNLVRRSPKRNIRVWLQDGAEDQENVNAGSWPLANIHMANSLKVKNYDYHFSFGVGTHNQAQGVTELPESLIWLWRDYDPAKTSQQFEQEPAEKDQPLWRVVELNRK
jgi:enterochelin esterase family protein